jgi:hypothetical protein
MRDLRDDLEPHDADELAGFAERRLMANRPVPRAAFRGELRRRLVGAQARLSSRPRRLWALVGTSLASGTALLMVAAIGVAGSGPLAA